ncbi:MAG: aminotransferase class V-fold PLP-dependent enzyme [Pseudomonadota bacterium]|mgnify:CR=1 FL=1
MKSLEEARALDAADPLRAFAAEFDLPDGVIYLDGNSLGPPTRKALTRLREAAETEWRHGLIRSWNDADWIDLPKRAGAKIAKLIGADADDVLVCDSVSVNIFKLASALIEKRPGAVLAVDAGEFPTDQYALEGAARMTGAPLIRLEAGETPENAVLIRSLVHYKTAEILDMAAAERIASARCCDIVWDLCHATGLVPIDMTRAGARFAVGCGYKFLNGGPGAPAFVYVAREEANTMTQPLSGWMGHAAPFDFASDYKPADGAARFAAGTPPVLSLIALDAALDLFEGVDLSALETKARALGDCFLACVRDLGLEPMKAPSRRGGHVCLKAGNGHQIMQALIARGVIGDFRAPDLMRFGFSPLFLSFEDVWNAGRALADVLSTEEWKRTEFSRRGKVT